MRGGYIALVSILIISAVLTLITLAASQLGIGQLKIAVGQSQASASLYLAQACAEAALRRLKEDVNYQGDESIDINGQTCQVLTIEGGGNQNRLVKTQSSLYGYAKKIKIEISRVNPAIEIKSWQEVADF